MHSSQSYTCFMYHLNVLLDLIVSNIVFKSSNNEMASKVPKCIPYAFHSDDFPLIFLCSDLN